MKKMKYILPVALIVVVLAVFCGYRAIAVMSSDGSSPKINMPEDVLQVSVGDPESALVNGITAEDKRDGDVTASIVVESIKLNDSTGAATVTYAAFDKSGNVAKASRQIQYTDYESPRFTLSKPLAFPQGANFDILSLIGAEDRLDGDITHRIRATPLDDAAITAYGTHDVEFRVTNSLGETVRLTLPVEIYSAGSYQGTLNLKQYLVYLNKGDKFDPEDYLDSVTFGSDTTYLRQSIPSGFSYTTEGNVDTDTPGLYTVDYEVSYSSGYYSSYTAYSKLIVIVEG